ncbi:hypothetical protein [Labrys neptuniae]
MFNYWMNLSMLAIEAQQVVWLRTLKMASGGQEAAREAERMVTEKIIAAQAAATTMMTGGSAKKVIGGYRKKVRSNVRRLSKST